MILRDETRADIDAIHSLTDHAFAPMALSVGTDAEIVRELRHAGDLTLSLVAEDMGQVIGHAAFSPVTIGEADGWFGLGPISVDGSRQRQGIGKALVSEGIERLISLGAHGCVVVGNPEIYGRMGFRSDAYLSHDNLGPPLVQYHWISGPQISGEVTFAPAFDLEKSAGWPRYGEPSPLRIRQQVFFGWHRRRD